MGSEHQAMCAFHVPALGAGNVAVPFTTPAKGRGGQGRKRNETSEDRIGDVRQESA